MSLACLQGYYGPCSATAFARVLVLELMSLDDSGLYGQKPTTDLIGKSTSEMKKRANYTSKNAVDLSARAEDKLCSGPAGIMLRGHGAR